MTKRDGWELGKRKANDSCMDPYPAMPGHDRVAESLRLGSGCGFLALSLACCGAEAGVDVQAEP